MNVLETNDYTIFKKMNGNRELNEYHIKQLMGSVVNNNLLSMHPIIVNKNMEVIDGQHRLEVARRLDTTIYYIIGDIQDFHLVEANVYQKKFTTADYINFFAKTKDSEEYRKLQVLAKKFNISHQSVLCLLFDVAGSTQVDRVKKGFFQFPPDHEFFDVANHYKRVTQFLEDRSVRPYSMFKTPAFCRAFRKICRMPEFDIEIMINKIEMRWFELKPQGNSEAWFNLLLKIYNYKNHKKIAANDAKGEL